MITITTKYIVYVNDMQETVTDRRYLAVGQKLVISWSSKHWKCRYVILVGVLISFMLQFLNASLT